MDSGLGSDDDRKGRTKEQKQLHNRLLSGRLTETAVDQRRNDERRQGAMLFQRSIPQFSTLRISEPCEDDDGFSLPRSDVQQFSETDTPYNSIEQIESETESVRRSPLGFYVDLSEVAEADAEPSSSTTKNIFSMVIDFEAPKKDKPVKLTSSLAVHRKNLAKHKAGNKSKPISKESSRLSSSTSSVNSNSVAGTSKHDDKKDYKPVEENDIELTKNDSVSPNSSSSSECIEEKDVDKIHKKLCKDEEEKVSLNAEVKNFNSSSSFSDNSELKSHEKPVNKTQSDSRFVKLSDLECRESRIDLNFTPCMSRSIPESSWVESPLLMCHSLGFRSAPRPLGPDGAPADHNTDSDSGRPKKFHNKLGTDLLRMFLEEIGPDVVVEVEGHKLKAHKCILASRCQYFAALLSGNWLEKNGNVISLKGFSYESVYFSLCHIYSGTMHVPDSIGLVELASLADTLCLEGLKEVVEHALKQRHCHDFHEPCAGCCTGVLEVLPLSAAYGLEDLYRKCLQWITQHFVRVWPSRAFASLPRELREKCYQQHVLHMHPEKVLETILNCNKILAALPRSRWVEPVSRLVVQLSDACHLYHRQHYSAVLGSDYFISLDADMGFGVHRVEEQMLSATKNLGVEQACRAYSRCCKMLDQMWSKPFMDVLIKIKIQLEQCLVHQSDKLIRSNAWLRLDTNLRNRIKELTPNLEPASRLPRATPRNAKSPTTPKLNSNNSSVSSSDSSRNSSPGMNQRSRMNPPNGTATSLRRSLLLAAKAPQVPPSPSTKRKSTLTQPTAASTAKATLPKKTPVQPRKEPLNVLPRRVTNRTVSTNVSRNTSFGRKDDHSGYLYKKPDSRATSPLKTDSSRKLISPRRVDSKVTSPIKVNTGASPMRSNSSDAAFKSNKTSSPKQSKAKSEIKEIPKMQRSSTFLKDEPTVLGKIL